MNSSVACFVSNGVFGGRLGLLIVNVEIVAFQTQVLYNSKKKLGGFYEKNFGFEFGDGIVFWWSIKCL